jgi:hypothetical protein
MAISDTTDPTPPAPPPITPTDVIYARIVMSVLVMLMFAGVLGFLVLHPSEGTTDGFLKIMIGILSAKFAAIISYWFGDAASKRSS